MRPQHSAQSAGWCPAVTARATRPRSFPDLLRPPHPSLLVTSAPLAHPGTIAEAAIRGLPTMLSSHLPGQEAGNVPFVVGKGFGEFSKQPKVG